MSESKSIQQPTGGDLFGAYSWLLTVMAEEESIPAYWTPQRDKWLRDFVYWPGNDLLAGIVSTIVAKVAATGWVLEGPERVVNLYHDILLRQSEFGAGWGTMIQKFAWDYLTQDAGAFIERIRLGEADTEGAAMGFAHLDPQRLILQADYEYPAKYVSPDETILLHRSRIIRVTDCPSPRQSLYGIGFCATSRAITTARILIDLARYERERLSDLPPAGILMLNNMTRQQWEDLQKGYEARQRQQGNRVWRDILVAFGLDPSLPLKAEILSFSQLPEQFDKRTATEIAIYSFCVAFRIDPREVWPVSSGALGTATETEIMHLKARAKGVGAILSALERAFNDGLSLPKSLTFRFDFQDTEEDEQAARIANLKAEFIGKLTRDQIIGTDEARRWLIKEGLFSEKELLTDMPDEETVSEDTESAKSFAHVDLGEHIIKYSDGRVYRPYRRWWNV